VRLRPCPSLQSDTLPPCIVFKAADHNGCIQSFSTWRASASDLVSCAPQDAVDVLCHRVGELCMPSSSITTPIATAVSRSNVQLLRSIRHRCCPSQRLRAGSMTPKASTTQTERMPTACARGSRRSMSQRSSDYYNNTAPDCFLPRLIG
jgi:hypothetical protein